MTPSEEAALAEALLFYTEGHHCDAYDDPAAAQHFGLMIATAYRRLLARSTVERGALEGIITVLGPNPPSHAGACDGCRAEVDTALGIARQALTKEKL